MKQKIILLFGVIMLSSCASQRSVWKLVWTEDFKGDAIDSSSWTRVRKGPSDWDDMMSQRPDLAYVKDGELVLLGKPGDTANGDETPFVTAGLQSSGKRSWRLGRVEIKARYNNVQGFWPALWLMPDASLPKPEYAEIDIMEHLNHETIAYQTVHSRYSLDRKANEQPAHSTSAPIKPGDWNIYATEVYKDSVCFFINGEKTLTYKRIPEAQYQFPWPDYPFYLILSNQLGGSWVGPVNRPEQMPSELRVDWIKVYQQKNAR